MMLIDSVGQEAVRMFLHYTMTLGSQLGRLKWLEMTQTGGLEEPGLEDPFTRWPPAWLKDSLSWDCQPECRHVAPPAWWSQGNQTSGIEVEGAKMSAPGNPGGSCMSLISSLKVT